MQMGFASWVGAYFGPDNPAGLDGPGVVVAAFCCGAVAGGAFAVVMIVLRSRFRDNIRTAGEILTDLRLFAGVDPRRAADRAQARRARWVKLPYGIPLCVGFLLYLGYVLVLPR